MSGMEHRHYEIPDLPAETLYEVTVEEKRRPERIRAADRTEAEKRIRSLLGYTPIGVREVRDE